MSRAFWLMAGHSRRVAACVCGAVDHANAWVDAPTVRRFVAAQELVQSGLADDLRVAWRGLSPVRRRPEVNAQAAAAWQARQERKARLSPRLREHVMAAPACAYCAGPATSIDHVVPVSQGGTHDRRNLVPACARCNSLKGKRTPAQWSDWLDSRAAAAATAA